MMKFTCKHGLIITACSGFLLSGFAQADAVPNSVNEQVSDVSNSASQALQTVLSAMTQYRAAFTQKVTDANGELVAESEGELMMARPNKLRWHTQFPDDTLLVADGKAVWHVDDFVEQVTVLNQADAVQNNPFVLLTTSDPLIWSQYTVSKEQSAEGLDKYIVRANNAEGLIKTLTLFFKDGVLSELAMLDSQEQVSHILFRDIALNHEFAPGQFQVSVPEGFAVDDQRQ